MNTEKFTQKTAEALNCASKTAEKYGNQQVCGLHLLYGVLSDREGLIYGLTEKAGGDPSGLLADTEAEIRNSTAVTVISREKKGCLFFLILSPSYL